MSDQKPACIVHDLQQGSPEWEQFRLTHYGASEAAVMLGISTKGTRSELLRLKYLGDSKQFSDWVRENILDKGHESEALARPITSDEIDDDLYPRVCSAKLMPAWANYEMSASLDGLTLSKRIAWEHKDWNEELAAAVRAGELPDEYMPQPQQIMMVTPAEKVIFTVSDGTKEKRVSMEIFPDAAWQERILAGWCQFDKDLAAYQLPEAEKVLAAEPVLALPAVSVQISGTIAVVNNFPAFEVAVRNFLENDLIREPKTDQDFVNLDLQIKEMKSGREAIKLAKGRIFSQMEAVDAAVRTAEMLDSLLQQNCSMAEKLLASEKERRRAELIETARKAMTAHGEALQSEIQGVRLAVAMPDFAGAIKGLKTLTSMKDKLDAALANGKAAADMAATDIRKKLAWVTEHADEHRALLADLQHLVSKPMEDFQLVVQTRIQQHQQRQEQERERIRQEEADRLQREAAVQQQNILAEKAQEAEAAAQAPRAVVAPSPAPVAAAPRREPSGLPTLRLGQICERIAPLSITADGLAALGYEPAKTEKAAKFYHEADFPAMCQAIATHVLTAANHQQKEAA